MNIRHLAAGAVTTAIMAASIGVQAQQQVAVTARTTNLRAGPATDYPVVAVLPAGFALAVQGCLPEYTWCDVIAGQSRGWMAAGNINYYYQNSYVPLSSYGAILGIGALGFVLNDYWGSHYRDRPFYRDRSHWEHRHFGEQGRRFVPDQRPGYIGQRPGYAAPGPDHDGWRGDRRDDGRRGDWRDHDGRRGDRPAAVPHDERPHAGAPNAAPPRAPQAQSGATQPNPPITREQQRQLNQGGSSSVDSSLRPQY